MVTYAAIPVNENTILELFAHVTDVPDGRSRLAWAMFKFPWVEGCDYFFIGGNYLGLNQPRYEKQILTRSELGSWFTYNQKSLERRNGPRANGSWFPIKVREGVVIPGSRRKNQEELTALCKGKQHERRTEERSYLDRHYPLRVLPDRR